MPIVPVESRSSIMSELRGEERLVTVVFADMTESVRRTTGLTPEAATQLVNPLLESMVELMHRYGGRIDRFLGDGVLAVFGVPAAHEDDPYRAVRAALDLRDRAADLGLAVTAGVNTGRVYFGPVGSDLHEELTVMGPVVNLAARFQGKADANEIVVGAATALHLTAAFDLTPETLTIKGMTEPVEAFKVRRILDHPDKVRGIEGLRAEMIGRHRELELLRAGLADGARVAVVAPAGVGKSRLAAEFRTEVTAAGGTWLEGRCLELTAGVPYGPFVDLLVRRLGSGDAAETVAAELEALVDGGLLDADRSAEILGFLVHLLGGELGDRRDLRVTESDDELRRTLTVDALVTFFAAQPRPAVVCLEDMHWSDPFSLLVLQTLEPDPGMLVLPTLRPDLAMGELGEATRELRLTELSPADGRRLVSALLHISGLPTWLESRIVGDAAGNPFYVEELIRSLIQRGAITRDDGHWRITADDIDLDLPPSVEGVLMSRFDRLGDDTRRAARAASILGADIDPDIFSELAGPDLVPELETLTRAGILTAGPETPPRYSFVHALGRQAVYSSLLPSQRAELHEHAGRTLEPSNDAERIAFHYALGRDDAKATEWLLAAGQRALETFAGDAALAHLEQGMERLARLAESEQVKWQSDYHFARGRLLGRNARHREAREALHAALVDANPLREAEIWRRIGQNHRLEDDPDSAHAAFDRAEQILTGMPDDDVAARQEWIRLQKERALTLYFSGRGRELPAHNARVGPVVERYGTDAQRADHLYGEALSSFVANRFVVPAATVATARRALELAERGADQGRVAEGRFVLGFSLLWANQAEEAVPVLERAVEETTRLGTVTEACRALSYRAIALRRLGRVDEAEAASVAALQSADRLDIDYYVGHALAVQCWVAMKRGDPACASLGAQAYETWGTLQRDGIEGINCEFVWLAAWPLAATALADGDHASAVGHLRLLLVPWERPMPDGLSGLVASAVETADPELLAACVREAKAAAFL